MCRLTCEAFQSFVPAHISSCCTKIWVNLLPSLGTHFSLSLLYCSSLVTLTYTPRLSFFPSSLLLCRIFSKWTFIFEATGSYIYFFIFWFIYLLIYIFSTRQDLKAGTQSNLIFRCEWRNHLSDFSPLAYHLKGLAFWFILSTVFYQFRVPSFVALYGLPFSHRFDLMELSKTVPGLSHSIDFCRGRSSLATNLVPGFSMEPCKELLYILQHLKWLCRYCLPFWWDLWCPNSVHEQVKTGANGHTLALAV